MLTNELKIIPNLSSQLNILFYVCITIKKRYNNILSDLDEHVNVLLLEESKI